MLARLLRERLETVLPQHLGQVAQYAGKLRSRVKKQFASMGERRRFWEKLFVNDRLAQSLANNDLKAVEETTEQMLSEPLDHRGEVVLVGAGPGDAGLLTLKGLQQIQQADVVVYDRLVSDDIIPNKVCLVPDLLKTLPYKPFAASAIDALIHATESFLSPHRKTVTSEMFSVKAMEMILEGFRRIALEGPDARIDYLGEFVTASLFAGIAFLKAGCATVHGMSFPLGGTYHVPHGESNYALFGKILEMYDEYEPAGELGKFKEIVARCLGCTKEDALRTLNVTLEKVLHLKPLHEYGFKEEDVKAFALSVDANQQRLITNSYRPWSIELSERVYKECF
ncbi:MAG: iron-containing alcohol dehydrogenase [Veillonella sp.]|nr:iron-containing alcohol dehydrogenase [Veillonella sp.]